MSFPQLNLENEKGPKALIKTNRGDINIQLFPELAPKTVQNFVELAKKVTMTASFSTVSFQIS